MMEGLFLEIIGSRPQYGLMMLQGLGLEPICLGMSCVIYVQGMPQRILQILFCREVKPEHTALPKQVWQVLKTNLKKKCNTKAGLIINKV